MAFIILIIEVGLIPFGTIALYDIEELPSWYSDLTVGLEVGPLYFVGNLQTLAYRYGRMFSPHTVVYGIEGGVKLKHLSFGYRHLCTHPVVPFYDFTNGTIIGDGGGDVFFMRFEYEN